MKKQSKEAIEAAKEFLTWQLGRSNRQEEDKLSSIIQSTIEKATEPLKAALERSHNRLLYVKIYDKGNF